MDIFTAAETKGKVLQFRDTLMAYYPSLNKAITTKLTLVLLKSFREMYFMQGMTFDGGFLIVDKMISVAGEIDVGVETLLNWSDKCKQSFYRRNAAYVNVTGEGNDDFAVPYGTLHQHFKQTLKALADVMGALQETSTEVLKMRQELAHTTSEVLLLKRKFDDLSAQIMGEDIDNTTVSTPTTLSKKAREPEKGGVLYAALTGETLRTIFYAWYVGECWNDIPDGSEKHVVYEARARQKKFARTVLLMHLLCPADKPETISSKPLPTFKEYAQWDKDIKCLAQTLDQKALEVIRANYSASGNRSLSTASKVGLERLQELYTHGIITFPSYVTDNACSKAAFLSIDSLNFGKKK
jgi:hypothetical protein